MSLTNCPDCGHEVSSTAAACPNCGYTMTPAASAGRAPAEDPAVRERVVYEKRRGSFATIVIGVLVVTLLVVAVLWYMGVLSFV